MYPETYNPAKYKSSHRSKKRILEDSFTCLHCGAVIYTQPMISGVQNRNHCPYCLSSRHLDHIQAGDRLSACKAVMQPVGLTVKHGRNRYGTLLMGEMMLIHRCNGCGKISINRIAADDLAEKLLEIFHRSTSLDQTLRLQMQESGIRLLMQEDCEIVCTELFGTVVV